MITSNEKKQIEEDNIIEIIESKVYTSLPCVVKSYDADKNRITVTPFGGIIINGRFTNYPVLNNIPVITFQSNGGKAGLSQAFNEGDLGLVIFVKNSFREFIQKYENQEEEKTEDTENIFPQFRYSDAVFLGGLYPKKSKTDDLSSEAMTIKKKKMKVEVYEDVVRIASREENSKNKIEVGKNYAQVKMGDNSAFINENYSQINTKGNKISITGNQIILEAKNGKYLFFDGEKLYINAEVDINGDLYVMGDIKLSGKVDGVDVSSHQHYWRYNGVNYLTSSPVK